MTQHNNNQLTPLEKLIFDKARLKKECQNREEKLSADLAYVQHHAGGILWSGVTSLLFPSSKSTTQEEETHPAPAHSPLAWGFSDYLSVAKGVLPLAWDIAQPMLISWGLKKTKDWASHLFFRKKK